MNQYHDRMNRTRIAYRACLALMGLVFLGSAVAALSGAYRVGLAGLAVGLLVMAAGSHLQLRVVLGTQRSILRTAQHHTRKHDEMLKRITDQATRVVTTVAALDVKPDLTPVTAGLNTLSQERASDATAWRVGLRALYRNIEGLQTELKEARERLAEQEETFAEHNKLLTAQNQRLDERHRWSVGQSTEFKKRLELLPSEVVEHQAMRHLIAQPQHHLPSLGGWALSSPSMTALVHEILGAQRPVTVVEFGSGSSTAYLSLALQAAGGGHVYSVEHEEDFAGATRNLVRTLGVEQFSTVLDAPLTDNRPDGPFYDTAPVPETPIDILLVDGPPAAEHPEVRYSGLAIMADRLRDGALVCLDDTARPGEQSIIDRWLADFPRLTLERRLEKSMLFRWN